MPTSQPQYFRQDVGSKPCFLDSTKISAALQAADTTAALAAVGVTLQPTVDMFT